MERCFGEFLKQKRLEKNLTQKELSKILYVTESAVSKWEKGVAHPDITMLPKLSEVLEVSEHELITASIDKRAREEKTQAKKWRVFSMSWSLFFYIAYGITILTCFICNLAVSGTLSWFWIVLSSLLLAFSFTNFPKLITKHKLVLIPIVEMISLIVLLGVCCIYSKGNWFWIASFSILLGFVVIFTPIYIAKLEVFSNIRKYNDFISVGLVFIVLNLLLGIINIYTAVNTISANKLWYFTIALPIVTFVYLILNLLFSVRFLKINKLLKTSIILITINVIVYILPLFIKVENIYLRKELDDINIFKADFSNWNESALLENNIHCIIFLTFLLLVVAFLISGLILHIKKKRKN